MTADDLERMNTIADKALNQIASVDELKEFNQLLTQWEQLPTIDLVEGSFTSMTDNKKY